MKTRLRNVGWALLLLPAMVWAQPKYEMRGAWLATVVGLDWPVTGATPASQQANLVTLLDRLKAAGINAVFFQVRTESDAMYKSDIEPWSYYLNGAQGKAPNPEWDPLTFVIAEAHKRGMELHVWFNPFRVIRSNSSTYTKDPKHISVKKPEWMLVISNITILNPGIPEARTYVHDVVMDIVNRYDVDGIHYDDYFYPYEGIGSQDETTYAQYGTGYRSIYDWRRDNINFFVKDLGEKIKAVKPWVKYGISPFGIWKSGVPTGIIGLSAYDTIYADAVTWLEQKWVDYLAPQLYWVFGGNQDYAKLAPWWKSKMNGAHLYPGLAVYRADDGTRGTAALFKPNEIGRQIRFNRANGIQGQLLFRARNIDGTYPSQGIADTLKTSLNAVPALPPVMDFKPKTVPPAPKNLTYFWNGDVITFYWGAPAAVAGEQKVWRYAVYRVQSAVEPDMAQVIADPKNLLTVLGDITYKDRPVKSSTPYWYFVTSVGANSVESTDKSMVAAVEGRATATEDEEMPEAFRMDAPYPNPFRDEVHFQLTLDRPMPITVRVVNLLGQTVDTPIQHELLDAGAQQVVWRPNAPLAAGLYLVVVEADGARVIRKIVKAN